MATRLENNMIIAFFDFDKTITSEDSFKQFLVFAVGRKKFCIGILKNFFTLVGYTLGLIPNYVAKEKLFSYFFKDLNTSELEGIAERFSREKLPGIVRSSAMKKILWHMQKKHQVVVVSASFEFYLKYWCKQHDLEIIGTKIEKLDGKVTGRFASKNCYGPEKVNRIKEKFNLSEFERVYAYGDSRGDREILEIADEKGYRIFT